MGHTPSFSGLFPALATPFREGLLDEGAFKTHLEWLCTHALKGVVVAGTTGESLTLTQTEKANLLTWARAIVKAPQKLIAGIALPHYKAVLLEAQSAESCGADALLVLPPYYVRADTKALEDFFINLHQHTSVPLIVYNNPGRLGFELSETLIKRLSTYPRILGLKEASPHLNRLLSFINLKTDWGLLSGDDITFPAFLSMGGHGIISVGANIAPHLYGDLITAFANNDLVGFKNSTEKLHLLHQALYCAPNPAPLKTALALRGWCGEEMRVPLSFLNQEERENLRHVLDSLGVAKNPSK